MINGSVHNDDLGEVIGFFHGIPVRSWDAKATDARDLADTRRIIAINHAFDAKAVEVPDHEFIDPSGFIRPMHEAPAVAA